VLKFITGTLGEFSYRATWGRGALGIVIWEGTVYRADRLVGGPSGQLTTGDEDSADLEVRKALEAAILGQRQFWQ
jgi:hypothetical protein